MGIGDRIKHCRLKKEKSQSEVAVLIGVKQATVSSWEKNRTEPDVQTIQKLAEALGTSASDLIGSPEPNEEKWDDTAFGAALDAVRKCQIANNTPLHPKKYFETVMRCYDAALTEPDPEKFKIIVMKIFVEAA